MTPALLLQHFDRISDAPDAIPRLRRFILDLAVRGKLVEQDPADEPASKLMERIAAEKARLGSTTRRTPSTKIHSGHTWRIPSSWIWAPFGDIVISRDGDRKPVSKEERNSRKKLYYYYGASGVIDKIDDYIFDKSLLLIGEDGANLVNRTTPIAFIAKGKYWVNNHAHVIDSIEESILKYMAIFINSIDLRPYLTGTAQPKMNQRNMNKIPVALPPLPEQYRIVAKVDELMALCDQFEAARTEREARRDRLIAASLHRLNQPQDSGDAQADAAALSAHARFHLDHLSRLFTRPDHIKSLRQTMSMPTEISPKVPE